MQIRAYYSTSGQKVSNLGWWLIRSGEAFARAQHLGFLRAEMDVTQLLFQQYKFNDALFVVCLRSEIEFLCNRETTRYIIHKGIPDGWRIPLLLSARAKNQRGFLFLAPPYSFCKRLHVPRPYLLRILIIIAQIKKSSWYWSRKSFSKCDLHVFLWRGNAF